MRSVVRLTVSIVFLASIAFLPVSGAFQETTGAKALFYDPASGSVVSPGEKKKDRTTRITRVKRVQPSRARFTGLHYWIELDGVGPVTADRIFRTGERIRVHIRSNVDGYLSLLSLSAAGVGKVLFPTGGSPGDDFIAADAGFVTPGKIRFSPPAEDERLLVVFSRSKSDMPDRSKGPIDPNVVASTQAAAGSKSLVFESEASNPSEIGDYVVNRTGGVIVKEIRLRHR